MKDIDEERPPIARMKIRTQVDGIFGQWIKDTSKVNVQRAVAAAVEKVGVLRVKTRARPQAIAPTGSRQS